MRSAQRIVGSEYPEKVVEGIAEVAENGRDQARTVTRQKFNLHSEYIPRGIKSIPSTPGQKKAAQRAIKRYSDMEAAVFLRPARDPKKSLDFMVPHEVSGEKVPHGKSDLLAVPTTNLKGRSGFTTPRGKVRNRWKPATLLKHFEDRGSSYDTNQRTTTNKGRKLGPKKKRLPGTAFLIGGKAGTMMIARRKTKRGDRNLEFLYSLVPRAKIKERWKFEPTIYNTVLATYDTTVIKWLNKMK
jgi:hypothetical protein